MNGSIGQPQYNGQRVSPISPNGNSHIRQPQYNGQRVSPMNRNDNSPTGINMQSEYPIHKSHNMSQPNKSHNYPYKQGYSQSQRSQQGHYNQPNSTQGYAQQQYYPG